jgi:hypothetical protein
MVKKLLAVVVIATAILAGCASNPGRYDKPGFTTVPSGRTLWVFRSDSPELAAFKADEEPARPVVRAGAGPAGMNLKAPDMATIDDYLAARGAFASTLPMDTKASVPPSVPPMEVRTYEPRGYESRGYEPPPAAAPAREDSRSAPQDGWYVTHPN